jgi:ComF family protein
VALCGECLAEPPPFVATVCAVEYRFPWPSLVWALKHHGGFEHAAGMAALMLRQAAERADPVPWPDAWVPVPMSRDRLAERGQSAAALLARALARQSARDCLVDGLWRVLDAPAQAELSRAQRLTNLRAAFAPSARAKGALEGKTVGLVDDVMTTGATARAAAAALLRAGAAAVQVWAFARTPGPKLA